MLARALACLSAIALVACAGGGPRQTGAAPEPESASEAFSAAQPASEAETESASAPGAAPSRGAPAHVQCPSGDQIAADLPLAWKMAAELSVVSLPPGQQLELRSNPGSSWPVVARLEHNQRQLHANAACRVGDDTWIEVRTEARSAMGWADARYLAPTTTPKDQTARYAAPLGGKSYASPRELTDALARSLVAAAPHADEVPYEVSIVGIAERGDASERRATAVIGICCYADDSLGGEQVWLELVREPTGSWRLVSATEMHLCIRGADGQLCR